MSKITLKAARISRGFTLKDAGKATNRHPETIRKYEINSLHIPRDLMRELLSLYKYAEEDIFFGKESVFNGLSREDAACG